MTAGSPTFVDTNAFVYADQKNSPFHVQAREAIARLEREGSALWISRQVLREYLATVTRPGSTGMPALSASVAASAVEAMLGVYDVAEDGPATTTHLLNLLRTVNVSGKQVHDANVAATMLAHGIRRLLTFNVADFRRFAGVIELVAP